MNFLIWIIISLVLALGEIFTAGFFMAFFAIGALITAAVALFTLNLTVQLVVFLISSIVSVILFRPIAKKMLKMGDKPDKMSNVDQLPGAKVLVLEPVSRYQGRVKVLHSGEVWSAYLNDTEPTDELPAQQEGYVSRIDGAKLVIQSQQPTPSP